MRSLSHSRRSWFFSAAEFVLPWVSEFLWGATPLLHTQHHRVPCSLRVFVREFLGLSASLGSFQAHFHLSFSDGEKGEKANPSDERTQVIQMCGGLGVQMRGKSSFPAMILPDSVRGW